MYQKITNPYTGRKVSIFSKTGQNILENYLRHSLGGAMPPPTVNVSNGNIPTINFNMKAYVFENKINYEKMLMDSNITEPNQYLARLYMKNKMNMKKKAIDEALNTIGSIKGSVTYAKNYDPGHELKTYRERITTPILDSSKRVGNRLEPKRPYMLNLSKAPSDFYPHDVTLSMDPKTQKPVFKANLNDSRIDPRFNTKIEEDIEEIRLGVDHINHNIVIVKCARKKEYVVIIGLADPQGSNSQYNFEPFIICGVVSAFNLASKKGYDKDQFKTEEVFVRLPPTGNDDDTYKFLKVGLDSTEGVMPNSLMERRLTLYPKHPFNVMTDP